MEIKMEEKGLKEVTRTLMSLPGIFTRARKSALKSSGWLVQQEMRNHIEYGGSSDWPPLHALTAAFKKKRTRGGKGNWIKRRSAPKSPMFWLGKFARYRVDSDGTFVQIDFGKSKRGPPGTVDPQLAATMRRTEKGERIRVTDAMRKKLAATRRKRPKNQISGVTYFPLKKSTHSLQIPKRPIFAPVWKKVKPKIPDYFEEKFYKALDRYISGGKKR